MKTVHYGDLSEKDKSFIEQTFTVQGNARAKSSGYKVGSVVISATGQAFSGCNVETTSYEVTHAERNAIDTMVASGQQIIGKIFIATKDGGPSCGACRQAIWEFVDGNTDVPIYMIDEQKNIRIATIGELYPYPFPLKPGTIRI
jgi:cytidine deaminase